MNDYARFLTTQQDNAKDEAIRIFGNLIPLALLALLLLGAIAYALI